jgi:hypothetical protein
VITAKQVWTEVFRLDRDNRQVRVERGDDGFVSLIIANPDDHFYVEVSMTGEDAQRLAAELMLEAPGRFPGMWDQER